MSKKSYGRAETIWEVTVGSLVAAQHLVAALQPYTAPPAPSKKTWLHIIPDAILVPDKPGGKYLIKFTYIYVAHNRYNTQYDAKKKIGEIFKKRAQFIHYDMRNLHEYPWKAIDCAEHENCCHTWHHQNYTKYKTPCDCEKRRLYALEQTA